MVRLMLVLAPIMCILSGVAVSNILRTFMPGMIGSSSSDDIVNRGVNSSSSISQKHFFSANKVSKNSVSGNYADATYPFRSQVGYKPV